MGKVGRRLAVVLVACGVGVALAPVASADAACPWEQNNVFMHVAKRTGTRCGSASSVEVDVTNTGLHAVKIYSCLENETGKPICSADGKFNDGVKTNDKINAFVCKGTGNYIIWSMPIEAYISGHCGWPPVQH